MRAFAIVCCALLATAVQADDDWNSSSKSRASKKPATRISTYVPPASIGAPRGRLSSGATRAVRLPGFGGKSGSGEPQEKFPKSAS